MGGTHSVTMGDRGRLVVPADVRERLNLTPGTRLILLEEDGHLTLMTPEQLLSSIRRQLADTPSLVDELVLERRRAAAAEDAESGAGSAP